MRLTIALYSLVIGILIVSTIGLGVETFYPSPKAPEYLSDLSYQATDKLNAEQVQKQKDFDKQQKEFDKKIQSYNQPVSIFLVFAGVVILAGASFLLTKMEIIMQGVTVGGVFTIFYGLGRAFGTNDPKYSFVSVLAALAATFFLIYRRFQKNVKSTTLAPVTKAKK